MVLTLKLYLCNTVRDTVTADFATLGTGMGTTLRGHRYQIICSFEACEHASRVCREAAPAKQTRAVPDRCLRESQLHGPTDNFTFAL